MIVVIVLVTDSMIVVEEERNIYELKVKIRRE